MINMVTDAEIKYTIKNLFPRAKYIEIKTPDIEERPGVIDIIVKFPWYYWCFLGIWHLIVRRKLECLTNIYGVCYIEYRIRVV